MLPIPQERASSGYLGLIELSQLGGDVTCKMETMDPGPPPRLKVVVQKDNVPSGVTLQRSNEPDFVTTKTATDAVRSIRTVAAAIAAGFTHALVEQ